MYELFDWKIKLGIIFTVVLFMASCITFIIAWNSPVPDDAMRAVTQFLDYRWFATCVTGCVLMVTATKRRYQRRLGLLN